MQALLKERLLSAWKVDNKKRCGLPRHLKNEDSIKSRSIWSTMRYHSTPMVTAQIEKADSNKCWQDREQLELSYVADRSVNWYNDFVELYGTFFNR